MSQIIECPNCFNEYKIHKSPNLSEDFTPNPKGFCSCEYNSPEEMIEDYDFGFNDPKWVKIAKHFLNHYHPVINEAKIEYKDEWMRFFLKLLQSSANKFGLSIELTDIKENESWSDVLDGKTSRKLKSIIFDENKIIYEDNEDEFQDEEIVFDFPNIKESIKKEFNVDIPISGGNGSSSENPIIIERAEINDYVGAEYACIKYMCKLKDLEWDITRKLTEQHNNRMMDVFYIYLEYKDGTATMATLYFDIDDCFRS